MIYFDMLLITSAFTIIGVYSGGVIEENPSIQWIFMKSPLETILLSLLINASYASLYVMVWLLSIALSAMCFKSLSSKKFMRMKKISFLYPILTFTMLSLNLINDLSIVFIGESILSISYVQYQGISISLSVIYLAVFYLSLAFYKVKINSHKMIREAI